MVRAIIKLTGISQDCGRKITNAIAKSQTRSQNHKRDRKITNAIAKSQTRSPTAAACADRT
ncbi:MAG: hypothetical protein F6K50_31400 [Moorea sp. SIO3I7]|uniref:hypothetical protein n=1 Tax=Moorena TaxID=1155738 RepID=UPI0013C7F728|nr:MULTISPECIES: hypothetical protein [Moorena]NEN99821.1 hypothetical protein [Moorena sp. SIO3I7]NEO95416.1 hypothetical protein [Moorena sp. SIO3G5]